MQEPIITFIEKGHKYIHEGRELESATEFISQFFEKFDKEKWSKHVAKRDGLTVEEVLELWKNKADASCKFGHYVHNYAEALIKKTKTPEPVTKNHKTYFKAIDKFMENENHEFFDAEKIIGSSTIGIAGMIDGLSRTDEGIFLIDWKTNKRIEKYGYNNRTCPPPLELLQDCKFSKYTLQLSLYRYILEKFYGWDVAGMMLVHLKAENYDIHEVKYLKEEIKTMLAHAGKL